MRLSRSMYKKKGIFLIAALLVLGLLGWVFQDYLGAAVTGGDVLDTGQIGVQVGTPVGITAPDIETRILFGNRSWLDDMKTSITLSSDRGSAVVALPDSGHVRRNVLVADVFVDGQRVRPRPWAESRSEGDSRVYEVSWFGNHAVDTEVKIAFRWKYRNPNGALIATTSAAEFLVLPEDEADGVADTTVSVDPNNTPSSCNESLTNTPVSGDGFSYANRLCLVSGQQVALQSNGGSGPLLGGTETYGALFRNNSSLVVFRYTNSAAIGLRWSVRDASFRNFDPTLQFSYGLAGGGSGIQTRFARTSCRGVDCTFTALIPLNGQLGTWVVSDVILQSGSIFDRAAPLVIDLPGSGVNAGEDGINPASAHYISFSLLQDTGERPLRFDGNVPGSKDRYLSHGTTCNNPNVALAPLPRIFLTGVSQPLSLEVICKTPSEGGDDFPVFIARGVSPTALNVVAQVLAPSGYVTLDRFGVQSDGEVREFKVEVLDRPIWSQAIIVSEQ